MEHAFLPRNQPFEFSRSKAQGLLSLPVGKQELILSGAFEPVVKDGDFRRRSIKLNFLLYNRNLLPMSIEIFKDISPAPIPENN
jgi:hypothetical protein